MLYQKRYGHLARNFFLLNQGATDEDLAHYLGVCPATVHNWKKKKPEFLESIKEGKEVANVEVACALYRRAVGFEITEQKLAKDGSVVDCKSFVPGDVQAMKLFLTNRTGWRDKTATEVTGKDGGPVDMVAATPEQLRERIRQLGGEAGLYKRHD